MSGSKGKSPTLTANSPVTKEERKKVIINKFSRKRVIYKQRNAAHDIDEAAF